MNWKRRLIICGIAKARWRRTLIIANSKVFFCRWRVFTRKAILISSHVIPRSIIFDRRGGGGGANYFSPDSAHGEGARSLLDVDVPKGKPAAADQAQSSGKYSAAVDAVCGDLSVGGQFCAALFPTRSD